MTAPTTFRITIMRSVLILIPILALTACGGGGGSADGDGTVVTPPDTTAPIVTSAAATNADGLGGSTTITVIATDNTAVTQVTANVSGFTAPGATNPLTLTQSGNTWTGSMAMQSGDVDATPFTVSISARDAAGNVATSSASAEVEAATLPPPTP